MGGGFARGIAHIGVLSVLEQEQIPIDFIAGTSVGALVAATYASGTPIDEMERHGAATKFGDFGRWTLSRMGMASNERLEDYLHKFTSARTFAEMKIPLCIVATDLIAGESVHFTDGEIGPALRASCAYPGLFLPVEYRNHFLVDGFLTETVPAPAVRKMGADVVISSSPGARLVGVQAAQYHRGDQPVVFHHPDCRHAILACGHRCSDRA